MVHCRGYGEGGGRVARDGAVPARCNCLVRMRTIDYIATDLVISFNMAKSHVRHVYVKMGVHARQELIDLIENKHAS